MIDFIVLFIPLNPYILNFQKFIASHFFDDIRKRAVFVHVDLPGQEDDADDMGDDTPFPTMQVA